MILCHLHSQCHRSLQSIRVHCVILIGTCRYVSTLIVHVHRARMYTVQPADELLLQISPKICTCRTLVRTQVQNHSVTNVHICGWNFDWYVNAAFDIKTKSWMYLGRNAYWSCIHNLRQYQHLIYIPVYVPPLSAFAYRIFAHLRTVFCVFIDARLVDPSLCLWDNICVFDRLLDVNYESISDEQSIVRIFVSVSAKSIVARNLLIYIFRGSSLVHLLLYSSSNLRKMNCSA